MLPVTAAAFVIVANPPVFIAHLLMASYAGACEPENSSEEDTEYRAVRKKLRQVKLWKLV
ncbi:hypothetical protein A3780_12580 [Kosakonia radicincitans]|nr:hypothetical protein A3780_12580 [Kosakonia radicincitans]